MLKLVEFIIGHCLVASTIKVGFQSFDHVIKGDGVMLGFWYDFFEGFLEVPGRKLSEEDISLVLQDPCCSGVVSEIFGWSFCYGFLRIFEFTHKFNKGIVHIVLVLLRVKL